LLRDTTDYNNRSPRRTLPTGCGRTKRSCRRRQRPLSRRTPEGNSRQARILRRDGVLHREGTLRRTGRTVSRGSCLLDEARVAR